MVFVKRNSHYSSFLRSSSPVEKQYSVASLDSTAFQEGAGRSCLMFDTCWLEEGGREMGSGPPTDPHPLPPIHGGRRGSPHCTFPSTIVFPLHYRPVRWRLHLSFTDEETETQRWWLARPEKADVAMRQSC